MAGQRCAAAEDEVDAPAQARLDLGEDQLVEERRRLRTAQPGDPAGAPQNLPGHALLMWALPQACLAHAQGYIVCYCHKSACEGSLEPSTPVIYCTSDQKAQDTVRH